MELDDLKNDWETVASQAARQNILTSKIINQMTQKKYYSKIIKIKYSELIGGIVCLLGLSFIGFNFNKLDTVFLQSIGVITILLLMILPIISFLSFDSIKPDRRFRQTIRRNNKTICKSENTISKISTSQCVSLLFTLSCNNYFIA